MQITLDNNSLLMFDMQRPGSSNNALAIGIKWHAFPA